MPLENTVFHACKSENKWMEAALVCVPTIASWNEELGMIIKDDEDGLLCRNLEEWQDKLEKLITNSQLRNTLSKNAHGRVLKKYTTMSVESEVVKTLSNQ